MTNNYVSCSLGRINSRNISYVTEQFWGKLFEYIQLNNVCLYNISGWSVQFPDILKGKFLSSPAKLWCPGLANPYQPWLLEWLSLQDAITGGLLCPL